MIDQLMAKARTLVFRPPRSEAQAPSLPTLVKVDINALKVEPAAPEAQQGIGVADAGSKMEAARCDQHPFYRLREATLGTATASGGDARARISTLHCTRSACVRHYTSERGYFNAVGETTPDFEALADRPKCHGGHKPRFLVVSKVREEFLWVCPEAGCLTGVAYEEPRMGR